MDKDDILLLLKILIPILALGILFGIILTIIFGESSDYTPQWRIIGTKLYYL